VLVKAGPSTIDPDYNISGRLMLHSLSVSKEIFIERSYQMKKAISILLLTSYFTLLLSGCANQVQKHTGTGTFPDYLAGKWVANQGGWEMTFTENGKIEKITHTLGRVEMKPNEKTTVPMRMEGTSVYEPGEWLIEYDSSKNELTVTITLEHFYAEVGSGTVEGKSRNLFVGELSEYNWYAEWTCFREAKANTPDFKDFDLSTPYWGDSRDIVFEKVE
jgi:hypothetical protein